MGQQKLIRFNAINTFSNVFQYPEGMNGKWNEYFGNNHPITLELACGKGEYSTGLGAMHSNRNFIGVDVKGNRIFIGARKALRDDMKNVAFLRTQILQLQEYFSQNEVAEIWIIFPDPFLRESKSQKRLTSPRFLSIYQKILKPGATINLKTDSKELYDFTLESIAETGCTIQENIADIYGRGKAVGALAIRTFYEEMHLAEGRTIYYLSFTLSENDIIPPPKKKKEEVSDNDE